MRRLPVVAAAGVGLVLALFGGAAACGCRSVAAGPAPGTYSQPPQPDDADETTIIPYSQPPKPDVPMKIMKIENSGASFLTQDNIPAELPEPPPLPPGTTPAFVRASRDGTNSVELVSVPALYLDFEVRLPENVPPGPRGLLWPPHGIPPLQSWNPQRFAPPLSVRVLEGDASVEMVPLTGERPTFGPRPYWILSGRASARIMWGPTQNGGLRAPTLPARLVLAPVVNVGGEEVIGQPIEITIRPLSQGD